MSIKRIALCIVVNDLYWQTRYCIENLLDKTSFKPKLYILNNGTTDKRLIDYCESLCFEEYGMHIVEDTPISMPNAKNKLISKAEEEYICFVSPNVLVGQWWLESLHNEYENIHDAGVLSIRSGKEKVRIVPYLRSSAGAEDCLENGWFQHNLSVEGIMFFRKSLVTEIGQFDDDLDAVGIDDLDFTFRINASGYKNMYITKHSVVKIPTQNDLLFPQITEKSLRILRTNIEEMTKLKNYKK